MNYIIGVEIFDKFLINIGRMLSGEITCGLDLSGMEFIALHLKFGS